MFKAPPAGSKLSPFVKALPFGLIFLLGFYFGLNNRSDELRAKTLQNVETPAEVKADFASFWRAWNLIEEKYVSPDRSELVPAEQRVWGATKGLLESLDDPNSVFFPPSELEIFREEINGSFEGIGIEIGWRDEALTVIAPLKGTPAERAGILAGDKILKVGNRETAGLKIDQAVSLIRGKRGTVVSLLLERPGRPAPFEVKVTRTVIDIPTLDTEWRGDVFVIRLYNFSPNSPDLFRRALREFVVSGSRKIILDLRNNPGGFLEASVEMASWFLPVGKVVVREDFGGKRDEVVHRSRGYNIFGPDLKIAVLINEGSASASEILAGSLSEHGAAVLVGRRSFGKGSVQELVQVSAETSMKITIARWLTPQGRSISAEGLNPDFEVETTAEDLTQGRDPVMDKALELLNR